MEKGDRIYFKYGGSKYIGETRRSIMLSKTGQIDIPYYPFLDSLFKIGAEILCQCTRRDKKVTRYDLDMEFIYNQIYDDDVVYSFKAIEVVKDMTSLRRYLLLTDEYGLKHKLYHPHKKDIEKIGQRIECLVVSSCSDGLLLKSLEATNDIIPDFHKQQELFDKLHSSRVEDYKVFSKKDFKGVLDDTVNKYPDTAHFIFELLQNADDTKATEVSFILNEDSLLFKHNGTVHFNVSDVDDDEATGHINSITAIGNSSKDDLTENKIGKFGVGFKSVFKYTEAPEIYDDIFRFKIEKFIIPSRIENDHDMREDGETLFVFPFTDPETAYDDIHEKLDKLGNATLFLHHLKKISWVDTTTDEVGEFSKTISEYHTIGNVLCEKLLLEDYNSTTSLWMLTREVKIPGHGVHPINIGYYLDSDGDINTKIHHCVHCFFPTEETFDRCFISHAPFVLVSSRQNLKPNEPANKLLVNELVQLASDSLIILRDLGLLGWNIFKIIGGEDSYRYYNNETPIRSSVIYDACIKKVKKEQLLLSCDGSFKNGSQLFIAQPTNIKEIVGSEMLRTLYGEDDADYMDDDLYDEFNDWEDVGVRTFSSTSLGQLITSEFMDSQESVWINKFFGFIIEDARSLWNKNTKDAVLRRSPILKTSTGQWVSAYLGDNLNIYYSGPGSEQYNVIDSSFAGLKNVKKFLGEIGCKEPDQLDYIKTSILSRYTEGASIKISVLDDDMLSLIRYSRKISLEERPSFIQLVASKVLLAFKRDNGQFGLTSPKDLFVDSEIISEYLTKHSSLNLIESSVYSKTIKEFGRTDVEKFLIDLGCKDKPGFCEPSFYFLSESQHEKIKDRETHHTCIHYKENDIEGLQECIRYNKLSKKLSRQIWSWLIDLNPDNYKTLRVDLFYRTNHYRSCDSTIVEFLREHAWLFNRDGNIVKPSEVTKEELDSGGYRYDTALFNLLGVKSKNIDIEALGGSAEDSKAYELGRKLQEHGITSAEDLEEFIAFKENKKQKEKADKEKKDQEKQLREEQDFLSREEMNSQGASDFSNVDTPDSSSGSSTREKTREEKRAEHEQKVKDIKEKAETDLEKELQQDELRNSVDSLEKYGKEWFETLLKLEYGEDQKKTSTNGKNISISFGTVAKEKGSERIYVLKSPSKCPIPIEIEELGGIEVQFSFRKREGFTKGFEVASVKDFTLRLKAKQGDIDFLDEVDWSDCTKAEINANNPAQLTGKLISAFKGLGKPDRFNFKANLNDNISFVFGPPGTGKTTFLTKKITELFEENYFCKILVLCPTNKACDVLTRKLYDTTVDYDKIGRFVATGDEEVENLGLVCNRDSRIYEEDQCCIISTMARLPYDGFSSPGGNWRLNEIDWDFIIIDEASMIPLAQIVYAIYQFEGTPIIIAGDPMQLSPIVHEEKWKGENIYSMIKLNRFDDPTTEPIQFEITNLETQYRSIPAIGRVFSEFAYSGKLKHYREDKDQMELELKGMPLKPINLIHFRVSKYDDIFGTKKLSGSNVQIYSVLLVVEFCKFLANEYERKKRQHNLTVGIICPYVAEAQMIEKLIEQIRAIPENITISVGTINGFQGDECDVVFTVFNPPAALRSCNNQEQAKKLFINDERLINVAISRAKDYMFVLIPHKDTAGWGWMKSIIRMGRIITEKPDDFTTHTSDELEKIIFGKPFFIENNSFITTHQLANVYTEAAQKYEIRIDETSVDVQIEQ